MISGRSVRSSISARRSGNSFSKMRSTSSGASSASRTGTTESYFNTIFRHDDHLSADATRLASCGPPLPLVYMKRIDGKGEEVPRDTVGELLVYNRMSRAC